MQLKFYQQVATPNRVDKSGYLEYKGFLNDIILKEDTNLLRPTFILTYRPVVYDSNYIYCDTTDRYYFVESIEALSAGRIALHCKCDVLYSFKDEIFNSSAWVEKSDRADTNRDYDLLHNNYPFRADYDIRGYDLVNGDNPFASEVSECIYLVVK